MGLFYRLSVVCANRIYDRNVGEKLNTALVSLYVKSFTGIDENIDDDLLASCVMYHS